VPAGQRFYLVNPWDQFSGLALEWYLATHRAPPVQRYSDVSAPIWVLKGSAWEEADTLLNTVRSAGIRYVVALEGGTGVLHVWPEYEFALGDALTRLSQQEFVNDYYDMTRWLKKHIVTRDELERAKSERYHELNIRVSVYRLADP